MELYDAEVCAGGDCRPGDDVNTVWYKVDGPGTVDFGDKNVVKTWARFSEAGIYTPGLEAVDGVDLKLFVNKWLYWCPYDWPGRVGKLGARYEGDFEHLSGFVWACYRA